ncbi:MAG: hypothetical protein HC923_11995 [Myxococcales bacterium]|nr:hypothetical protein [Myxococcales bacterium]
MSQPQALVRLAAMGRPPGATKPTWTEFECPECTAHNPWDDGFSPGDEVFCAWCGARLEVRRAGVDGDKFKLLPS